MTEPIRHIIDKNLTSVVEDVEKREPLCSVGENVRWSSPVENSTQFSQKIKIELPLDPAVSFLGIYPKKMKKLSAAHRSKTSGSSCALLFFNFSAGQREC